MTVREQSTDFWGYAGPLVAYGPIPWQDVLQQYLGRKSWFWLPLNLCSVSCSVCYNPICVSSVAWLGCECHSSDLKHDDFSDDGDDFVSASARTTSNEV
jgi:hypothetical protein